MVNNSSTGILKYLAIFNASSTDGVYLPFSIAMIVCLLTLSVSASSSWVMPRSWRIFCAVLCTYSSIILSRLYAHAPVCQAGLTNKNLFPRIIFLKLR